MANVGRSSRAGPVISRRRIERSWTVTPLGPPSQVVIVPKSPVPPSLPERFLRTSWVPERTATAYPLQPPATSPTFYEGLQPDSFLRLQWCPERSQIVYPLGPASQVVVVPASPVPPTLLDRPIPPWNPERSATAWGPYTNIIPPSPVPPAAPERFGRPWWNPEKSNVSVVQGPASQLVVVPPSPVQPVLPEVFARRAWTPVPSGETAPPQQQTGTPVAIPTTLFPASADADTATLNVDGQSLVIDSGQFVDYLVSTATGGNFHISASISDVIGGSVQLLVDGAVVDTWNHGVSLSGLVGAWALDGNGQGEGGGADASNHNSVTFSPGEANYAADFDGSTNYLEVPDSDSLSPATSGEAMTISAWMDPFNFSFTGEDVGYVHWLGKGTSGQQEWTFRLYNSTAQDPPGTSRAKRCSFYCFNLAGGLGAGSYFQDDLQPGQWIHVTGKVDGTYTYIYKNGVLRDQDLLSDFSISMGNGTAPMRLGTRDFASFFPGAIDNLRVYNRALSDAEVAQLYNADVTPSSYSTPVSLAAGNHTIRVRYASGGRATVSPITVSIVAPPPTLGRSRTGPVIFRRRWNRSGYFAPILPQLAIPKDPVPPLLPERFLRTAWNPGAGRSWTDYPVINEIVAAPHALIAVSPGSVEINEPFYVTATMSNDGGLRTMRVKQVIPLISPSMAALDRPFTADLDGSGLCLAGTQPILIPPDGEANFYWTGAAFQAGTYVLSVVIIDSTGVAYIPSPPVFVTIKGVSS